jgi:uncharacterized heparinase superfamily protein
LAGGPVHSRRWVFNDNSLLVTDRVQGQYRFAEARFHLHPAVTVDQLRELSPQSWVATLRLPAGRRLAFSVQGGAIRMEPTAWSPEFGLSQPNSCVIVDFLSDEILTSISWDDRS